MKVRPLILLMGTTASGKTRLALQLAKVLKGEVICGDALQLWKGISILSAAPTEEERLMVPHHLFEVYTPCLKQEGHGLSFEFEKKTVRDWYASVVDVLCQMKSDHVPLIVGGTHYFYLFFLSQPGTRDLLIRLQLQPILIFCDAQDALKRRAVARIVSMIDQGLLIEVSTLLHRLSPEQINRVTNGYVKDGVSDGIMQAIGLREFICAAYHNSALNDLLNPSTEHTTLPDCHLVAKATHSLLSSIVSSGLDPIVRNTSLEQFADSLPCTREGAMQLGTVFCALLEHTLAYAKQQKKWIYRFERHGLELLKIDTSTLEDDAVLIRTSQEICQTVSANASGIINYTFNALEENQVKYCEVCKVIVTGDKSFAEHLKSRSHKRRFFWKDRK